MKTQILLVLVILGIVLQLQTLDPIYTGIYNEQTNEWVSFGIIQPETYTYNLTMDLAPNETGYFFYNLGFGRYE